MQSDGTLYCATTWQTSVDCPALRCVACAADAVSRVLALQVVHELSAAGILGMTTSAVKGAQPSQSLSEIGEPADLLSEVSTKQRFCTLLDLCMLSEQAYRCCRCTIAELCCLWVTVRLPTRAGAGVQGGTRERYKVSAHRPYGPLPLPPQRALPDSSWPACWRDVDAYVGVSACTWPRRGG